MGYLLVAMKVLVIEDSEALRRSLSAGLRHCGFVVDLAGDGAEGLAFALAFDYDVIVHDHMLPGLSGLEVLDRLRAERRSTHVLILSAKDQVEDRVKGLRRGADDYLVKPFALDELLARLEALARRRHDQKAPAIELGEISIDTVQRLARAGDQTIPLTPGEYRILEGLALRRGRVLSKRDLVDLLHDADDAVTENAVEVAISGLRRKLAAATPQETVKTRRGHGYFVD